MDPPGSRSDGDELRTHERPDRGNYGSGSNRYERGDRRTELHKGIREHLCHQVSLLEVALDCASFMNIIARLMEESMNCVFGKLTKGGFCNGSNIRYKNLV